MHLQRINTVSFCSARQAAWKLTKEQAKSILKDEPHLKKLGESLYAEMRTGKLNIDKSSTQAVKPTVTVVKIKRSAAPINRDSHHELPCTI